MSIDHANTIYHDIQILFSAGSIGSLSDGELLERFVVRRDEAAFAVLVERHGSMVLGVCRRILRNNHDAEDAFQATFLVLARKASSVKPREMVANWLHGVARKAAMKARTTINKRGREKLVQRLPELEVAPSTQWDGLQLIIDEELSRLPAKYRVPIVLCHLEGKSYNEAARQLGWAEGTLSGRLSRARTLLASRLVRRGLVISAGSLLTLATETATSATVPASLMKLTVKVACPYAAGQTLASSRIAVLTQGVLTSMLIKKFSANAVAIIGLTVILGLASGVTLFGNQKPSAKSDEPPAHRNPIPVVPVSSPIPAVAEWYTIESKVKVDGGKPAEVP